MVPNGPKVVSDSFLPFGGMGGGGHRLFFSNVQNYCNIGRGGLPYDHDDEKTIDNDLRIFTWPTGGHCDDDDDEEEDEDGEGRGYVAPASVQAQLFGIPAVFCSSNCIFMSIRYACSVVSGPVD